MRKIRIGQLALTLTVVAFVGCNRSPKASQEDILVSHIDTTVNPANDFFQFANGRWIKENPIPSSESSWGIAHVVQEETYNRLKEISVSAAEQKEAPKGTALQKIGDFYASAMDTVAIEKLGAIPLMPELKKIDALADTKSVLQLSANYQTYLNETFFGIGIGQDMKNSEKIALYIGQGGLGLPDRDYYFNTDARSANIRKEYVAHISRTLQLAGTKATEATIQAQQIMKLETQLATKSRKLEELRDPNSNYHKMTLAQLSKLAPSIDWQSYFTTMGVKTVDSLIVGQPEFFVQLNSLLKTTPIADLKAYMKWNYITSLAEQLSKSFVDEMFHFHGKVLSGSLTQRERWKEVLDAEESSMGDLLGQLYVSKYFSPKTKKRYELLVDNIMAVYKERIEKLDWMSAATKTKAIEKLSKVNKKVGYPDKWKNYSALTISRESYVQNSINVRKFHFNFELAKLGKPVDRTLWDMTPQTYNAYYNPSNNEIVLPAACFIVPNMPDSLLDDAIVYAYAGGSTISHEITHGFDDEGRQFDWKGNLSSWWTKADETKFNQKAQRMVDQFNSYVVVDKMHANGKASLGENIADLGGVVLGLEAFKKTEQYKSGKKIGGYTPLQRFFLGYALSWLGSQRKEKLAQMVMTDVHAPAFLRVNGPLANIPEFYEAFGVKPSDPMYRDEKRRVAIW